MYYAIDAVRWGAGGHIERVRWHRVDVDDAGKLRESAPEEVPVVDASVACEASEVRVYVGGASSAQFFKMKACPDGIDAEVDECGTPLKERMAHLPTF